MSRRLLTGLLACGVLLATPGCSSLRRGVDAIGKWAADPLVRSDTEQVDLLMLLEENLPARAAPAASAVSEAAPRGDPRPYGQRLEAALARAEQLPQEDYASLRRTVLQVLRRQSNLLCQEYKLDLLRKQARGNFLLGTASLFLGTAGALVPHVQSARVLSGAGAFSTGLRSEVHQDYYADKTATVLSKAIDKKREFQWRLIEANADQPKARYSLRGALADMEEYHATCSLIGALSELERAIDTIDVLQSVDAAASAASRYQGLRERLTLPSGPAAPAAVP